MSLVNFDSVCRSQFLLAPNGSRRFNVKACITFCCLRVVDRAIQGKRRPPISGESASRPHHFILALLIFSMVLTLPRAIGATAPPSVLTNEIHYAPDVKTELVEFVELHNPSASSVDLSSWSITGGIDYRFPSGVSIAPEGYVVVAQNPQALKAKFGVDGTGPWGGRLSDTGDKVSLRDAGGEIVDQVEYKLGFPWPTVGTPPGYSIELIHPKLDNSLGGRADIRPRGCDRRLKDSYPRRLYLEVPQRDKRGVTSDDSLARCRI